MWILLIQHLTSLILCRFRGIFGSLSRRDFSHLFFIFFLFINALLIQRICDILNKEVRYDVPNDKNFSDFHSFN